jgi:hypothetical protein
VSKWRAGLAGQNAMSALRRLSAHPISSSAGSTSVFAFCVPIAACSFSSFNAWLSPVAHVFSLVRVGTARWRASKLHGQWHNQRGATPRARGAPGAVNEVLDDGRERQAVRGERTRDARHVCCAECDQRTTGDSDGRGSVPAETTLRLRPMAVPLGRFCAGDVSATRREGRARDFGLVLRARRGARVQPVHCAPWTGRRRPSHGAGLCARAGAQTRRRGSKTLRGAGVAGASGAGTGIDADWGWSRVHKRVVGHVQRLQRRQNPSLSDVRRWPSRRSRERSVLPRRRQSAMSGGQSSSWSRFGTRQLSLSKAAVPALWLRMAQSSDTGNGRCQTYFPGDQLRAINRIRDLSGRIKQRNKLIISGTNQQSKARRRGRRMLNKSACDHRTAAYAFERRGASNAVNRESSDVHRCSSPAAMMLRKMLLFNVSFMDRFPAPPTHTLRRNSLLETIVPGRHNNLRVALPACNVLDRSAALPPAAPALPEQFLSEEELQELWSEVGHWMALRVIQPGGLNHKYISSTSRGTLSLTHHRLATLLLSRYALPHPLLGHTCGYNTSSVWRTEQPFIVVAGIDILQYTEYASWDEAAARLLAFAPPVSFYSCASARKPAWTLDLGPLTLKNCVHIGDTVYVDHSGYYAGGVVSDVFLEQWASDPVGFRRCLVEGAWMDYQAASGDGSEFYLLVHEDWCLRKARPVYPMRWIISDLDHSSVDLDFQDGAFLCLRSARCDNLIIAQSGCQPTSESGRSRHCWTVDEAPSAHRLHCVLVRAFHTNQIVCTPPEEPSEAD